MATVVLQPKSGAGIASTVELLRAGQLVAVPTETVYGLAGDGLKPEVVAQIFEAKERPTFDPLILHVAGFEWIERIAHLPRAAHFQALIERFWPGPLTVLLEKRSIVPDLTTAGLPTVAVRMPAHPVFRAVLQQFDRPVAAPSANRFGRLSPTTARHVLEELGGRIAAVLDDGPTPLGIESTIVRIVEDGFEVLRPGPITNEQLQSLAPVRESPIGAVIEAPGQLQNHYAPAKPIELLAGSIPDDAAESGLLGWLPHARGENFKAVYWLTQTGDMHEAAAQLFDLLRRLDATDISKIYVEPVPEEGLGRAIMNRLRRATAPRG
jgi:L-threonylcarbamoyladenylate synthase